MTWLFVFTHPPGVRDHNLTFVADSAAKELRESMARTITVAIGVATALGVKLALALPLVPVDLDAFPLGPPIGEVEVDTFTVALSPRLTIGLLESQVFFDGRRYAYLHTVTPTTGSNVQLDTEFDADGFTGIAGWRFADAKLAGGSGGAVDFELHRVGGRLRWIARLGDSWDANEEITFFFVSTRPPGSGSYSLLSTRAGSATTLAPVAETSRLR